MKILSKIEKDFAMEKYKNGFSAREIAKTLGCSENTIHTLRNKRGIDAHFPNLQKRIVEGMENKKQSEIVAEPEDIEKKSEIVAEPDAVLCELKKLNANIEKLFTSLGV